MLMGMLQQYVPLVGKVIGEAFVCLRDTVSHSSRLRT